MDHVINHSSAKSPTEAVIKILKSESEPATPVLGQHSMAFEAAQEEEEEERKDDYEKWFTRMKDF
jgi:hypothetical protein